MCELFAMSSRSEARLQYSLGKFATHGGDCYSNRDGWGIVFYEGRDAQLFKEPSAASSSNLAKMVSDKAYPAKLVMAHVRLATAGDSSLANTHPFRRVHGGRSYHFAHNGDLEGYVEEHKGSRLDEERLGDTDSELAFMDLLARLGVAAPDAEFQSLEVRFSIFCDFCSKMAQYGSSNFLFSDGDALFVHGHRRRYETENGRGPAKPPGLHIRQCRRTTDDGRWDTEGAHIEQMDPQTILIASVPLNEEGWEALPEGCALAISDGEIRLRQVTI